MVWCLQSFLPIVLSVPISHLNFILLIILLLCISFGEVFIDISSSLLVLSSVTSFLLLDFAMTFFISVTSFLICSGFSWNFYLLTFYLSEFVVVVVVFFFFLVNFSIKAHYILIILILNQLSKSSKSVPYLIFALSFQTVNLFLKAEHIVSGDTL